MSDSMLNRIWRRLHNVVAFGHLAAPMDDTGHTPMLQVTLSGIETHPGLQKVGHFGFRSSPPVGSGVVALFNGGDRSRGVVLGSIGAGVPGAPLAEGEVAVGPSETIEIRFQSGLITIRHPAKVRVETPRLECTGEVVAQCDGAFVTLSGHKGHDGGSQPPTPET